MNEQIWRTTSDFDITVKKLERQLRNVRENKDAAPELVQETFDKVTRIDKDIKAFNNQLTEKQNELFDKDEELRELQTQVGDNHKLA